MYSKLGNNLSVTDPFEILLETMFTKKLNVFEIGLHLLLWQFCFQYIKCLSASQI